MPELRENAISLLRRTVIADFNAAAISTLYAVPVGKILIPDMLVFHSNDASLAATGTGDVNIGGGSDDCISPVWIDAWAGFEDMTAVGDYYILRADAAENIVIDGDNATAADRVFALEVVTGADGTPTVTVDLFGYLFDS